MNKGKERIRNGQRETGVLCAGVGHILWRHWPGLYHGGSECRESGFESKGHVWTSNGFKLEKDRPDMHF